MCFFRPRANKFVRATQKLFGQHAETGRYAEAIQAARRGIDAAVQQGANTDGLRQRLAQYERKELSRE